MVTFKQELALTGDGNGLLTSAKSLQTPPPVSVSTALATLRLQAPLVGKSHTLTVCCATVPAQTLPNVVDPVTLMLPGGALPLTETVPSKGLGSLLIVVSVAVEGPYALGWNRIGAARELPMSMFSGNFTTDEGRKSPEVELIALTERLHVP